MRNLKKILALVLALVMSLSLMATAGASNFTDASSINDKYETAVEVLEGLGVFKGYQEGSSYNFKPDGEITRGEVAAIIYRIATGDVKDENVSIYADYNKFTDVPSTLWSAGYINFCANAEYIKGEGNGKFNPEGKVTGYQALAMILRAIGYTANGGFTGTGWDLQTAAVAESKHITDNIQAGTLGMNATRQTVAEILFRAILVDMVNYDQRTGYYDLGQSLGYKIFKLEPIEGVVVANEFANLKGNAVLKEGKTHLQVGDVVRSLDVTSQLTDIGESRRAYVAESTVLSDLEDTGKNTVYDCVQDEGKGIKASDAIKKIGRSVEGTTQYFTNFDNVNYYLSDSRIEYEIIVNLTPAQRATYVADNNNTGYFTNWADSDGNLWPAYNWETGRYIDGAYQYQYHKVIPVGQKITLTDYENIQTIFYYSNGIYRNDDNTTLTDGIGRVYVRTQTNKDISDEISFREFEDTYLNDTAWNAWDESQNGEWVKIVDNDSDGVVDYAFLTEYHLDRVVGTYTKSGETYLQYYSLDATSDDYTIVGADSLKVGDTFLYTKIDGRVDTEVITPVQDAAVTVNYKDTTVTLKDGGVKGQSGIDNETEMAENVTAMDANVTYDIYFDKYGYIRAYELPGGTEYALVTEVYSTNANVGNVMQGWPLTVELTTTDGTTAEYGLTNASNSPLVTTKAWTMIRNRAMVNANYYNYLQPAIAHLGYSEASLSDVRPTTADLTFWANSGQRINSLPSALGQGHEFNYGTLQNYTNALTGAAVPQTNGTVSFTNVAIVTKTGDSSVSLASAAKYRLNKDGSIQTRTVGNTTENIFDVDYIQLSTANVAAGQRQYSIGGSNGYVSTNNNYVNATHDTQYFIAYDGHVYAFSDYANMPALTNEANTIHAAYAVARNTAADYAERDYWVADVIVYEVKTFNNAKNTSIALGYYNNMKSVASAAGVRYLESLDNKAEGTQVTIRPRNSVWDGTQWGYDGMGFYKVYDGSEVANGEMSASKIEKIPYSYNAEGIFAGFIARDSVIDVQGGYIDVNMNRAVDVAGENINQTTDRMSVDISTFYSVTLNSDRTITSSDDLVVARGDVNPGDRLIWVMNGDAVAYLVNLGDPNSQWAVSRDRAAYTPSWLTEIYNAIMAEQVTFDSDKTFAITVNTVGLPAGQNLSQTTSAAWGDNVTIDFSSDRYNNFLRRAGYTIKDAAVASGSEDVINATWDGSAKTFTLTNVKGNVVIELTYEPTPHDVALAAAPTDIGTTTISSVEASDARDNTATLVYNSDALTSAYNKTVTLTVNLSQELKDYENLAYKIETASGRSVSCSVAQSDDDAWTYTFTMPDENVNVSFEVVGIESTITYVLDDRTIGTDTWEPASGALDYTVSVPLTGYTVSGWIARVGYTTLSGNDGDTISVSNWAKDITIVVTAEIDKFDVTFTNNYTGGTVTAGWSADTTTSENIVNGLSDATIGTRIYVKVVGVQPFTMSASGDTWNVENMTSVGDNTWIYEIEACDVDGSGITVTLA